jgi:predicted TIM-barrel fold metal-dependent hydrolase
MRAIDLHTHPVFMGDGVATTALDGFVARARAQGIVRMVVLGDVLVHGPRPNASQVASINDTTYRVTRAHPDFFIPFCCLNPLLGARSLTMELERCVGGRGFRGIKLEISNNARDACMTPLMHAAAAWDIPVLQHSWSQTNIRQRSFHSDPADTALLARRFPNVQVIMAHLTGCGFRGVLEAKGISNLVVDTSGGMPEDNLIEYAVEHLGADHVVYGSDLPIRETATTMGRILGARIGDAAKRQILYENAHRILKL